MKKNNITTYKKWYKYLIGIVIWALVACLLFFGAMMLDSMQPDGSSEEMTGHKAPVFMILSIPLIAVMMSIVVLRAIIKIIKSLKYYKNIDRSQTE